MSSHTSENGLYQKAQKLSFGKDMGKGMLTHTSGTATWFSLENRTSQKV